MENIKDTVHSVIEALTNKKNSDYKDNPASWLQQVLTKREYNHIKVNYFKRGVLSIKVDSSSWLYYFNLQKDKLTNNLRKKSEQIKNIRFCIGDVK